MSPQAALAKLFNNETYSDLIVSNGSQTWYCHKCIVFPTAHFLRDMCKTGKASRKDDNKDRLIISSRLSHSSLDLVLRSMYQSVEENIAKLPLGNPGVVDLFVAAQACGHEELAKTAFQILRVGLEREHSVKELWFRIEDMKYSCSKELHQLAEEITVARMPELLLLKNSLLYLHSGTIRKWLESVEICAKSNKMHDSSTQEVSRKPAAMDDISKLILSDDGHLELLLFAKRSGYPKLRAAASTALRSTLEKSTDKTALCSVFKACKDKEDPDLLVLVNEIQIKRMPYLLVAEELRSEIDSGNVEKWFKSVDIRKKVDGTKIDIPNTDIAHGKTAEEKARGSASKTAISRQRSPGGEGEGRPTKVQRTS